MNTLAGMIFGKVYSCELAEVLYGSEVISVRGGNRISKNSESNSDRLNSDDGDPSIELPGSVLAQYVNALEPRLRVNIDPVGLVFRGISYAEIGYSVVKRFFRTFVVDLDFRFEYAHNQPMHLDLNLLVGSNCEASCCVPPILALHFSGVPPPLHESSVVDGVDYGVLSLSESDVANRWIGRLLDIGTLRLALHALSSSSMHGAATFWARAVGIFDRLSRRLDSLVFSHGVCHDCTSSASYGNLAATPIFYQNWSAA